MSVILALGRLGQEDYAFEASLGCTVRLCLKKINKQSHPTPQILSAKAQTQGGVGDGRIAQDIWRCDALVGTTG
jgi:hypothetical protein